ncbi:lipoprotein [Salmonella enterica subsp. enterica]|uniref:Lipoprotein n=1 Tax=Salmonella enterica I TaxID=59201 RepID=A0A379UML8_SALET|nr:lipoprotein [Salmonella enterica subsp. enterica]
MKKWLVVIMAFWLASCSSGGENKSYYQLPIAQSGVQSTASQGNRLLWVEQVSVPDYLAGNGVVYQTSDVQYVIANNNLWASRWISNCVTRWWRILAPGFLAGSSLPSRWEPPRIR